MGKEKREYLKCLGYDDLIPLIASLLDVESSKLIITKNPLISPTKASVAFTLKGEDKEFYTIIDQFECRIFTKLIYGFDTMYKKSFGLLMSELIEAKHKQKATKLTPEQYQQDYNAYHQQKFEQQKAKAELEHLQQLF